MKKFIHATIFALLFCTCAFGQNTAVRVTIKNEKNEPVQNATAQILHVSDTSLYLVKTIKTDAYFSLRSGSSYFLKITAVNIEDVFRKISIGEKDTIISIVAQSKSKSLDAVVVTSKKPLMKQEDDKTIVDAEVLANSSTNAYEVLEKTPGGVVDQDGNVYLNSATPAVVYINGREIKLSAGDLASLLKSLPANSISKIEILRTPSAKYDASGSGGIVNIVLKKGVKLGLNGSIEVSHYQGVYPTNSFGFNINNSGEKLNTYLSGNVTRRTNFERLSSLRPLGDTLFTQTSYTRYPNLNNYIGGGADYQINDKWSIGYEARVTVNKNKSRADNLIDLQKISNGMPVGSNFSNINNSGPSVYLGNNIYSKLKIDSAGSEWENSFDYNYFNSNNDQDYINTNRFPSAAQIIGDGNTKGRKNIVLFTSDLVLKTKAKYTVETGIKISNSNSSNNALYYVDYGSGRRLNTFQTSNFKYLENIGAAYFQVSKTFAGFTIKPGARVERTDIKGHQIFPVDTVFRIKRTDLFPYIYLRHEIAKLFGFMLTGNAIVRRSITRPSYEALNPYPKFVDQYTYDVGNPALQPQFTTNYEINVTADEFPVFSLGLNDIKNIFNSLTYQRGVTLYRTFDNLGRNREVYMRLVGGIPPGPGKYFFYAGGQMNIANYKGFYGGKPFTYHRNSWNFFMYHNYKPSPTLNIGLNGWMRVNGVANFFELKSFGSANITANKSILKKKMNVVLSVNDIFRTNRNTFDINVPGFIGSGLRYGDTRKIGLTVKYNFGIRPREDKKQNFDVPAE